MTEITANYLIALTIFILFLIIILLSLMLKDKNDIIESIKIYDGMLEEQIRFMEHTIEEFKETNTKLNIENELLKSCIKPFDWNIPNVFPNIVTYATSEGRRCANETIEAIKKYKQSISVPIIGKDGKPINITECKPSFGRTFDE